MIKSKFKFYTQRGYYLRFRKKTRTRTRQNVAALLAMFIMEVVVGSCLRVGNACYRNFLKLIKATENQSLRTAAAARLRLNLIRRDSFVKTLAIFLAVSALGYGGLCAFNLLARGLELKNQLAGLGAAGGQALLAAKNDLRQKNFTGAENKFRLAYESFSNGGKQLMRENFLLNQLLNLLPQKRGFNNLFSAAALLSGAGEDMTRLFAQAGSWKISPAGLLAGGGPGPDITGADQLARQALLKVNQAGALLAQTDPNILPAAYREKLLSATDNFIALQKALHSLSDLLLLGKNLVGGDKRVLVLMENNNELRPGGGFIGTFGDFKIGNAAIKSVNISSVYDLDGQLKEKIRPPFPIFAVNERWFLRDSNWFANFPASAKKISEFYEKEGGETPDTIVALTPTVIQNLLKLTGPIVLPKYGVTLTADNFVEVTQVQASVNYSPYDNKPKQILADLLPVLLARLGSPPKDRFPQLLQILQDSFNQKQLVLYSRDPETQSLIMSLNWGGAVFASDRDYLSVISANLNGSKTDLYLKQTIDLKTTIDEQGNITDELSITKTNTLPDLPNTANASFVRVLAPLGSVLVSNLGFDYNTSTPPDASGYKIDPEVAAWEKTVVKDLISGTSLGQESAKTFFGNWLTVRGGQTKTIRLIYRLPFTLNRLDHFSLVLQKQIGALPVNFSYSLSFPSRQLLWQNFSPTDLRTNGFTHQFEFNRDSLFGEVLLGD